MKQTAQIFLEGESLALSLRGVPGSKIFSGNNNESRSLFSHFMMKS